MSFILENIFYTTIGGTIDNTPRYPDGEIDSEVWAKMAYLVCQIKGGGSAMFWILMNQKIKEHLDANLFNKDQLNMLKMTPELNMNTKFFLSE